MKMEKILGFTIPIICMLLLGLALKEKDEKEAYKQMLEIDTAIHHYKPIRYLPYKYRDTLEKYTLKELDAYYTLCHPVACASPDTTWKVCYQDTDIGDEHCAWHPDLRTAIAKLQWLTGLDQVKYEDGKKIIIKNGTPHTMRPNMKPITDDY